MTRIRSVYRPVEMGLYTLLRLFTGSAYSLFFLASGPMRLSKIKSRRMTEIGEE